MKLGFKQYFTNGLTLIILLFTLSVSGQQSTRVRGKVIDKNTKEPLPFVNVSFVGKNIGTITDYKGYFSIETQWASGRLQASFVGYEKQSFPINLGESQLVNFELQSNQIQLEEFEIKAKKIRYRNKSNPAVDLIKKVIENKDKNRKEALSFYEYDKYEKIEFDLNNISEKFMNRKAFRKLQFIFNYVDTAAINGKPYLPVFLKESASKVYYRKTPKAEKEFVSGTKMIGFHDYIDNQGIETLVDYLYQDIDIYENNVTLLTNQFVSPLSPLSPSIYKFHIIDTVLIRDQSCIELALQPRNRFDFAFRGKLYVTNDDRYAVIKADLRITKDINLNFVNDLQIIQEFEFVNDKNWMIVEDQIVVDFNLGEKGIGMFGKKSNHYDNYLFDQMRKDSIYKGVENKITEDGYTERADSFWEANRIAELTEEEENIYVMMDSVQNVPAFKRTMDLVMLLVAGYWNFGDIDIGPVNTFYSFNDVEGFRMRIGGKTSDKFSKRLRLDGYVLYGFKSEEFKYSASATWSLNKRGLKTGPKHTLTGMYQVESNFPGMEVQFINEDNFLLSFKRGLADKILYYKMYRLEHYREWKDGFSTTLNFERIIQEPGGTLSFDYDNNSIADITSSEFTARIRYAPNEKYYQGIDYRTPIITKYPILQLTYTQGLKGLFNADHSYSKFKFNIFKRFHMAPLGFTNFEIEAGKVFGSNIPFPLLYIPRANQTYSYQLRSYNLMNFLEFISDQYVSVYAEHHFYGFIFNKIPLLKRLKWREIISFKGVYGGVTDKNNPEYTAGLMKFPVNADGSKSTYTFNDDPYLEVSVGVGNIFKLFRVDFVKRLTYLENPNVSSYGIRARFKFEF